MVLARAVTASSALSPIAGVVSSSGALGITATHGQRHQPSLRQVATNDAVGDASGSRSPADSSISRHSSSVKGLSRSSSSPALFSPRPRMNSSSIGSASFNRGTPGQSKRLFSSSARVSASSVKDPYATLGVKRDASNKDIKSAYYGLAKKFHPDTSKEKGAKERFVEIQSAYDILSDEKKKAAFDQYGTTDGSPGFDPFGGAGGGSPFGGFGGGGGFGGFQSFGGGGNAQDIFEGLFGAFGGGGRTRGGQAGFAGEARGEDLDTSVTISFEEACRGTTRSVTIAPVERCSTCTGNGMKHGAKKRTCGVCNGTGTRTFVIQNGFQMASTCPACGGAGQSVAQGDECGTCEGVGRVRSRKTVEVKIPPGVDDGAKIRMDGAGDVPLQGSGPPGSLYVRIGVRPSKTWRRQGTNLYYPATVPFHTAILGGKVRVPTLDGDVDVRVPAGTQVGDEMLLRGRGVTSLLRRGDKGDLLVQFEVTIPRSLTKRQKEILQQYVDEVEGRKPTPPPQESSAPPPQQDASKTSSKPAEEPKSPPPDPSPSTDASPSTAASEEKKVADKEAEEQKKASTEKREADVSQDKDNDDAKGKAASTADDKTNN